METADEVDLLIYRESQAEYLRFLEIAFGSLRESHDRLGLSKRLGYSYERGIS
ncbi:MAG: four helix bundle protein [Desulfatiglandales bacterium]